MIRNIEELEIGKTYKIEFWSCDGCAGGEFISQLKEKEKDSTTHWSNGLAVWWASFEAEEIIKE